MKKHNFLRLTNVPFDVIKLNQEVLAAEAKHRFLNKSVSGWSSIPVRSVNGMEGEKGNLGSGINNSVKPEDYRYTTVMKECPYLQSILESFGAPILKVRIMKLIRNKVIGTHIDQFQDDKVIRFHIPVLTDENVRFFVGKDNKYLEAGHMYWVNVRNPHYVTNTSKTIDRIHIVFDMYQNKAIEDLFQKSAVPI